MQCSLRGRILLVMHLLARQGSNTRLEKQIAFHCKDTLPSCGSEALGVKWFCGCCEGKAFSAVQCSGVAGVVGCIKAAVCAQAEAVTSVLYFYQHEKEMGAQEMWCLSERPRLLVAYREVWACYFWPCFAPGSQLCMCLSLLTDVCPRRSAVSFFTHRLLSNSTGNCSNFLK